MAHPPQDASGAHPSPHRLPHTPQSYGYLLLAPEEDGSDVSKCLISLLEVCVYELSEKVGLVGAY